MSIPSFIKECQFFCDKCHHIYTVRINMMEKLVHHSCPLCGMTHTIWLERNK